MAQVMRTFSIRTKLIPFLVVTASLVFHLPIKAQELSIEQTETELKSVFGLEKL